MPLMLMVMMMLIALMVTLFMDVLMKVVLLRMMWMMVGRLMVTSASATLPQHEQHHEQKPHLSHYVYEEHDHQGHQQLASTP